MSDYHPMETRRRSRSKTPFSRPICDQENCEHTDEEDNYHHKKKMASATAGAPKVQTITEEIVEVTSSTSSSAQRDANKKIRTSDYSSDDTSPDYSKVKSRAAIELHPNEVNETVTYITTASTTTTTSGGSSTLITKSRKTMSSDNNSAATSTPKANYAVNSFAAQFATSPADILNESKGAGLREGHLEQVNATQSAINTEFEKPLQRNSMAARAKKGDNADRQRNQNNSNNSTSSGIRSIGRFFSKSFGGTRGAGDSGGGGSGGSEGDIDNVGSLSDHIAYREYKRAGEYWKTTPKTDYTYSKLSPHRRVLAPGVVAMPNMSRRSLENHHERINYMIECNPTNESFIRRRYESPKYSVNRRWDTAKLIYDSGDEVDLAQFDDIILKQSQESWFTRSITSVIAVFSTIWRTILTGIPFTNDNRYRRSKIVNEKKGLFGSLSNGFRSVVYNVFQSIYLLISYILSVDTWLLRSSNPEGKGKKRFLLFLLILLPLLLLTGFYYYLHPNEPFPPSSFSQHINTFVIPELNLSNLINPSKFETYKTIAYDRFEDFRDWTNDYLSYLSTVSQNIAEEGRKFFRREEFYTRI